MIISPTTTSSLTPSPFSLSPPSLSLLHFLSPHFLSPMSSSPPPPPPPPPPPSAASPPPAAPPPQPPRKFPAPCWNQEETLALISAYQDKWYSLRRRNLRTADWEAVADDVSRRCPNSSPRKTSAQCRHKMEKLRKRYRTEKQRLLSLPPLHHHHNQAARFFPSSSWVFFDLMESMESGSDVLNPKNPQIVVHNGFSGKSDLNLKPKVGAITNYNSTNNNNNNSSKDELGKYFDEILMGVSGGGGGSGSNPMKFKIKNHNQFQKNHGFDDANHDDDDDDYDGGYEFMKSGSGGGLKRKFGQDYEERFESSSSRKMMINGGSSKSGLGSGSRSRSKGDAVGEMVAAIKMMGEGMMRMEKMKMEMMREIERMRMEMEMKRSEMILESQNLIVNAFVEGFKKKNKKVEVMEVD